MKKHLIVAPPPEALTGISYFTYRVFGDDPRFDIEYCCEVYNESSNYRKAISITANFHQYSTVTLVLGNSSHNILAALVLQLTRGYKGSGVKIFVEIHDPVLSNILHQSEKVLASHGVIFPRDTHKDFYFFKLNAFADDSPDIDALYENHSIWQLHIKYGIMSARYLANNFPIYGLIFHSKYATNAYLDKLSLSNTIVPSLVSLYHPCFDELHDRTTSTREFAVGVFGVMDNGGKMTNISERVIDKIRRNFPNQKFVFAGYNANEWINTNAIDVTNCSVFNNPSREKLFEIMCNTKIALQPRASNSGESSGIIPMLIAASTYAIVSNIGAFTEYNLDSILPLDNARFKQQAINAVTKLLNNNANVDFSANADYIKKHSVSSFKDKIYSILCDSAKVPFIRISSNKIALGLSTKNLISETRIYS